jgi:uncharacterized protein YbbC (DUF1343 family)
MSKVSIMLLALFFAAAPLKASASSPEMIVGAERLTQYLPLLADKRVGLVVNQTSMVGNRHLLDILITNGVDVQVLFAPEHGIRGNVGAGEFIDSGIDAKTGVAIQSIYGKQKTPPDALMQTLDVIVFDIQDVGVRFYTYISSMHYMMESAAKHGLQFIVLDRPNPNGMFIDGPVLDPAFQSFVGKHPIPVLHGLTVAELASMIKGEAWIQNAHALKLTLVKVQGYQKHMSYSLPIPPSPNLPNDAAVRWYPSLCFFEATAVSVGRGTDFPFQQIGHNVVKLGEHVFTPESRPYSAPSPKLEGKKLYGKDLRGESRDGLSLDLLIQSYTLFKQQQETFFTSPDFMDKLAGGDTLRLAIEAKRTESDIRKDWQEALIKYKQQIQPYLIYPNDF